MVHSVNSQSTRALRVARRLSDGECLGLPELRELIVEFDGKERALVTELRKLALIETARIEAVSSRKSKNASINPDAPIIPDYAILRQIGSGGFSTVWLGRNIHDDCFYAVKVLRAGKENDLNGVREFKQRAKTNDHLIPVHHVGSSGALLFYVMPLADDANESNSLISPEAYEPLTLERYLVRNKRLAARHVQEIASHLLLGLQGLHKAGIVHRDVKPANIMRYQGRWCLGDPGMMTSDSDSDAGGTIGFSPPNPSNTASDDLYGVGKTIFLMLSGKGLSSFDSYDFTSEVPSTARILSTVQQACAENPAKRFETADAMRAKLSAPATKKHRWKGTSVAILLAVAMAAVTLGSSVAPDTIRQATMVSGPSQVEELTDENGNSPTSVASHKIDRPLDTAETKQVATVDLQGIMLLDFSIELVSPQLTSLFAVKQAHSLDKEGHYRTVAKFDRPCYAYVIAFSPDGQKLALHWPQPTDEPLAICKVPSGTHMQPIAQAGVHAVALFITSTPLSIDEHWQQFEEVSWERNTLELDVAWTYEYQCFDFGPKLRQFGIPTKSVLSPPEALSKLAKELESIPNMNFVKFDTFSAR